MMKELLHELKMKELKLRAEVNYKLGNTVKGDYLAAEIITETLLYNYKGRYIKSLWN